MLFFQSIDKDYHNDIFVQQPIAITLHNARFTICTAPCQWHPMSQSLCSKSVTEVSP